MTNATQHPPDQDELYTGSGPLIGFALAGSLGILTSLAALPVVAPGLAATLLGSTPKAYWYLSRGSAFIALGLLWISSLLGLLITNKVARSWPGTAAAFAIHEYVSLLGLVFAAFHAVVLLGDRFMDFQLFEILIPFAATDYRPIWTGLGQVGLYVWVLVAASFYVRRRIGQNTWRVLHYASFFLFLVTVFHGLAAGTDTSASWAQYLYWCMGGSILFLTLYRIAAGLAGPENRAPARVPVPPGQPQNP
jgi:predicted ferric reductase